ncbi:MAG: OmpA family protein [Bradymonadia bacterium]
MLNSRARISITCTLAALGLSACGGAQTGPEDDPYADNQEITQVQYEEKTRELLDATEQLQSTQTQLDDQKRRLSSICADYPDHHACEIHARAIYAREAFCSEEEFVKHVNEVVSACHQGMCKQVDQAEQISRDQYMLLTRRLPHTLITFPANGTKLDATDKAQMQRFIENLRGEKGYVIIVGRASKDGPWRKNLELALKRAEHTRQYMVGQIGLDKTKVGYITYGHSKMYLTDLDVERLTNKRLSTKQANRSALIFAYPCYESDDAVF